MQFSVYFYPALLLILLFPMLSETAYAGWTALRVRGKLRKMYLDVELDATAKVKSIQHIKRMFYKNTVYQTSKQIYDIRKKYKRMVFLLNYTEGLEYQRQIKNMLEVQELNMDIDKLVHMLELDDWANQKRSHAHERRKPALRTNVTKNKETQKQRSALRLQMAKIRNNNMQSVKKSMNMEDGFDSY